MDKKLKIAILSLSIFPVMASASLAPALGAIAVYFSDAPKLLISLIVTLPSLLIAATALFGGSFLKVLSIKQMAIISILLYLFGGVGGAFSQNIYMLLIFRSIIGIATGMLMPLSTSLIAYFSKQEEIRKLMGYSSALLYLGGIIGLISCGFLLKISWRMPFFIYSIAIVPLILVLLYLPNMMLEKPKTKTKLKDLKTIFPYSFGLIIGNIVLYTFVANFSFLIVGSGIFPQHLIGIVMSCNSIIAFVIGLSFSKITALLKDKTKYLLALALLIGLTIFATGNTLIAMIIAACTFGIGTGIILPLINSKVSNTVSKENVATAMSINSVFISVGKFTSPIIVSSLQFINYNASLSFPFYVGIAFTIILGIMFSRQTLYEK